jgi:hypothetical protein
MAYRWGLSFDGDETGCGPLASDRVLLEKAFIFMFVLGLKPVITRYQILPVTSQLLPPIALAVMPKARFGIPLL